MTCERCPCPDTCLRRTSFCAWAAADPPDPVHLRTICVRSAMGETPAPAPAYPPLATMAANALGAAARFIASGGATVDRAEFDRRRAICEGCDQLDPEQDRCRKCGCYLSVKPWGAREACPLSKW